jgi:hypothetical protein
MRAKPMRSLDEITAGDFDRILIRREAAKHLPGFTGNRG